jgi:ribonucleotide reductase alpha subunit
MKEIERVFEVLERLDLSREAVVIPLKPAHPGTVRLLEEGKNKGKVEIVVESEQPLDEWLPVLEHRLRALLAG